MIWKIVGIFLFLAPLFPIEIVLQKWPVTFFKNPTELSTWIVEILGWLIVSWIIAYLIPISFINQLENYFCRVLQKLKMLPSRYYFLFLNLIVFLILAFIFNFQPSLIDAYAQVFQAKVFADFKLSAQLPEFSNFFFIPNIIEKDGYIFSQYPPGNSIVLALFEFLQLRILFPLILVTLCSYAFYKLIKLVYGEAESRISLFLLLISPFFLLQVTSFMNHLFALTVLVAFVYFILAWEKNALIRNLLGAGFFLGLALITRPYDAFLIALVFIDKLILIIRRKQFLALLSASLVLLIVVSLWALNNYLTVNDPFISGYSYLWGKGHSLGFHETPWGEVFTPYQGIINQLNNLLLINKNLFETFLPALWPIALTLLFFKLDNFFKRLLIGFFIYVLGYGLYWHNDHYLGPRFWYSALIFLIPLTAQALRQIYSFCENNPAKIIFSEKVKLKNFSLVALVLLLVTTIFYAQPNKYLSVGYANPNSSYHLQAKLEEQSISEALVLIPVSWGYRTIARLRAKNIEASVVETAYRKVDHCKLHELLQRHDLSPESFNEILFKLIAEKSSLIKTDKLNGDPSLRIDPNYQPSQSCLDEINYDKQGYSDYTPYFHLNNADFKAPFVFAIDQKESNSELFKKYPNLPKYIYRNGKLSEVL